MLSIQGAGRLTRDPQLRKLPDGTPVCEVRLAIDRMGRGDKTGYLNFCEYGNAGEAAAAVLRKGWKVFVDGRLEFHEWDGEGGGKRSSYSGVGHIEFLAAPRDHTKAGSPDDDIAF